MSRQLSPSACNYFEAESKLQTGPFTGISENRWRPPSGTRDCCRSGLVNHTAKQDEGAQDDAQRWLCHEYRVAPHFGQTSRNAPLCPICGPKGKRKRSGLSEKSCSRISRSNSDKHLIVPFRDNIIRYVPISECVT